MTKHKKTYDCVGIGLCAYDHLCLIEKYPQADEKVSAIEYSRQGGGPVATAMAAMGKLGADVAFVGRVGGDDEGRFVIRALEEMGVDASRVEVRRGERTALAFCWVEKGTGRRAIVLSMEALKPMTERDVRAKNFPRGRFLLMDGRDIGACLKAARLTRRRGGEVVVDIGSPRDRMDELFGLTDYFIASHAFVKNFFNGRVRDETACRRILAEGPKVAVVTLGERGSIVATGDEIIRVPAFRRRGFVVDTTGAGDVFHGAFVFGLIKGWGLERCARFANAAAFMKCGRIGGRAGIPTRRAVERFLKENWKR